MAHDPVTVSVVLILQDLFPFTDQTFVRIVSRMSRTPYSSLLELLYKSEVTLEAVVNVSTLLIGYGSRIGALLIFRTAAV